MRKKKQRKAETITISDVKKANFCQDIRELYGRAIIAANEAGWKDYKFINSAKGRTVVVERTK